MPGNLINSFRYAGGAAFDVLYIGGAASYATADANDVSLYDEIETFDNVFSITWMDDDDANPTSVSGYDVVYISSTTTGPNIQDLETAATPIILNKYAAADNMNYQADGGSMPTASRSAFYVKNTTHAISVAAGLDSTGVHELTVGNKGHRRLNAAYGTDAVVIANDEDDQNAVLIVYDDAEDMANSATAPARRIYTSLNGTHIDDQTGTVVTDIFIALIDWAGGAL